MDSCPRCATQFKRHYVRKGQRQIYCSKTCRFQSGWTERECPTCHKIYKVHKFHLKKRQYCSLSCTQRSPCLLCGAIIMGRRVFQSGERRFCSKKCAAFVNFTLARGKYPVMGFAMTIKRFGQIQCERCGELRIGALCVHHKDRDKKNRQPDNLMTLCGTCHYIEHWADSAAKIKQVELAHRVAEHL